MIIPVLINSVVIPALVILAGILFVKKFKKWPVLIPLFAVGAFVGGLYLARGDLSFPPRLSHEWLLVFAVLGLVFFFCKSFLVLFPEFVHFLIRLVLMGTVGYFLMGSFTSNYSFNETLFLLFIVSLFFSTFQWAQVSLYEKRGERVWFLAVLVGLAHLLLASIAFGSLLLTQIVQIWCVVLSVVFVVSLKFRELPLKGLLEISSFLLVGFNLLVFTFLEAPWVIALTSGVSLFVPFWRFKSPSWTKIDGALMLAVWIILTAIVGTLVWSPIKNLN